MKEALQVYDEIIAMLHANIDEADEAGLEYSEFNRAYKIIRSEVARMKLEYIDSIK